MIESLDKTVGLRALESSDLDLLYSWRNHEPFRCFFREHRELSHEFIRSWYSKMIDDPKVEMFSIVDLNSNEMVGISGFTSIDMINRHADVHFYIGHNYSWIDDCYADKIFHPFLQYGFNCFNFNKLWAEIYSIDHLKLQFFKSYSFQVDASLREHYFFKGTYVTSHILSLLRSDYEF